VRKDLLGKVTSGGSLTREEAREVGRDLASGTFESVEVAALLGALAARGEIPDEVTGLAEAFREAASPFPPYPGAVDTCGTGGDHRGTFNVSTVAALLVASMGVPVAKHGNRSVSSSCGSADLLESAGYPVSEAPASARDRLDEHGFAFLFAPVYHPAMARVAPIRKALGVRTTFNLMGPLLNPAGVRRQVVGVFDEGRMSLAAEALVELGAERALVVHGRGGYDEAVLCAPTRVLETKGDKIGRYELSASDFGFAEGKPEDLAGGDAERNRALFLEILSGEGNRGLMCTVAANAALALRAVGSCENLRDGAGRALEQLGSGEVEAYFRRVLGSSDGGGRA
jgi:anthranilate phosphoribosyltransferase